MKLAVFAVGVLAFAPFRRVFGQNNVEWDDYDGTVTKGPANRDLETYMVKISDTGEVLVGI